MNNEAQEERQHNNVLVFLAPHALLSVVGNNVIISSQKTAVTEDEALTYNMFALILVI